MITIALSKGRIFDETVPLLAAAGIATREDAYSSRKLILDTNRREVRVIIVRATDVPTYVQYGAADIGVAGKDVLDEHGGQGLYQPLDLGIARCRMVVAVAEGYDYSQAVRQGARLKVATKYVQTAREHFAAKGMHVDLIKLYGSMELAPLVGLADAIVDLVSTGNTLKAKRSYRGGRDRVRVRAVDREPGGVEAQARRDPAFARRVRTRGGVMRRLSTAQPDFDARLEEVLAFEAAQDPRIDESVAAILADVKARGDDALLEYTRRFDGTRIAHARELEIGRDACEKALAGLPETQRRALTTAAERVRAYHERQRAASWSYADAEGNELGQRITALDRVGIYVPGGKGRISVFGHHEHGACESCGRARNHHGRADTRR